MKKKLKIYFTDFWPNFDPENNLFTDLLSTEYDLEITDKNPDLLIYSVFGYQFQKFKCKRLIFIGENVRANFNECDYSFSFDYIDDPRNYRLPLYALYREKGNIWDLTKEKDPERILAEKKHFCNFIYSNPGQPVRNKFFHQLFKYKKVDAAGKLFRNTDFVVDDKLDFIKLYKFTIAFENSSFPGYTTEKLFEPMLSNSIPIYWGNTLVHQDFNTKSFINYHDFSSAEDVIEKIKELDNDDTKYMEMLSQPYFIENTPNEYVADDKILNNFREIIESDITPVGSKSKLNTSKGLAYDIELQRIKTAWFMSVYSNKIKNFKMYKLKIKFEKFLNKKADHHRKR